MHSNYAVVVAFLILVELYILVLYVTLGEYMYFMIASSLNANAYQICIQLCNVALICTYPHSLIPTIFSTPTTDIPIFTDILLLFQNRGRGAENFCM